MPLQVPFLGYMHVRVFCQEAIEWLYDHPKVLKTGVGILGVSKGAELALHMAAYNSKVRHPV